MYCAQFMKIGHSTALGRGMDTFMKKLRGGYAKLLHVCLDNRFKVVIGSLLLFGFSLFLLTAVKKEFVPAQDSSRFSIRFQTPVGTSLDVTEQAMRRIEDFLTSRGEVDSNFSFVGGFGGGEVNTGQMMLTLREPGDRPPDPVPGLAARHRLTL
jgi:multidrug efflux pump subunit AcrB